MLFVWSLLIVVNVFMDLGHILGDLRHHLGSRVFQGYATSMYQLECTEPIFLSSCAPQMCYL